MLAEKRVDADDFNDVPAGPVDAKPKHSWTPVDLFGWAANPPPKPTISGIGYPGMRHLVSGEPDTCKTWLVLHLALEQMRNERTVLYVDFENGPMIILDRLRALPVTEDTLRDQFIYMNPREPIGNTGVLDDLGMMLAVSKPSMCVLDSSAGALSLHDCEPNSAKDIERFAQAVLNPLREHGAATFLIDHVTKDKDTRGRFASGSERKLGVTDVHLGMETLVPFARGRTGKVKIVNHKDRIGWLPPRQKIAELELASNPTDGTILCSLTMATGDQEQASNPSAFRPTKLMERVSRHLEEYPGAMSKSQLRDMVKGRDEYVLMAIDALHADGFVSIESGERGTRLVRSEKPYREAWETVNNPVETSLQTSQQAPVPTRSPLVPEQVNVVTDDDIPF